LPFFQKPPGSKWPISLLRILRVPLFIQGHNCHAVSAPGRHEKPKQNPENKLMQ